jgi:FkbM family methyltransferase
MTDLESGQSAPYGTYAPPPVLRAALNVTRRLPQTWAGKRAALALRRSVMWTLFGKPVDIESIGARMRLYPYRNVCEGRLLFTPQFFDAEERAFLAAQIRDGFVFVDVGANVGGYSLFVAALAGPRARIIAVEPQPTIFERLVFNIRQNPFGTIKALDCAIADKNGDLTLFIHPDNQGETSVKIVGSTEQEALKVPARTLLQLFRDEGFTRVDAVKLDVEGAEDLIVEPFLRTAPRSLWPRFFLIENGSARWQLDLPAFLEQHGYRLTQTTRLNLIFELQDQAGASKS